MLNWKRVSIAPLLGATGMRTRGEDLDVSSPRGAKLSSSRGDTA
jgi:hypothetical protein